MSYECDRIVNWYRHYKYYKNRDLSQPLTYDKKLWRAHLEHSYEMGAYVLLTNTYCLYAPSVSPNFNRVITEEIKNLIPAVQMCIANCRIIGRLCVGNKKGLLVPNSIQDVELEQLKSALPDSVLIKPLDERLSALGNIISCNDKYALIHPECEKETEEIIADTLGVEVFRRMIGDKDLIGSYCKFNETGGLVHLNTTDQEIEELVDLIGIPLMRGTVNGGQINIGSGIVVNNFRGLTGQWTTVSEMAVLELIFGLDGNVMEEGDKATLLSLKEKKVE